MTDKRYLSVETREEMRKKIETEPWYGPIIDLLDHASYMDTMSEAAKAQMERMISDAGDFHEHNDSLLDECEKMLKEVEWGGFNTQEYAQPTCACPICEAEEIQYIGEDEVMPRHNDDCALSSLRTKLEKKL